VYLNSTVSHWNVPIFPVQEKETTSPLVGQPHKPVTALGMDEPLQLCAAVVHSETILSVTAILPIIATSLWIFTAKPYENPAAPHGSSEPKHLTAHL
jgi:hypothetical protein